MRTALVGLGVAIVLAPAALLSGGGRAVAAPAADVAAGRPLVELSLDGTGWSGDLQQPLFGAGGRWVPGDSRTATFLVRPSADATTVRVTLTSRDRHGLLDRGDVLVHASASGGAWRRLSGPGTSLEVGQVKAGVTVPVQVRASYAWMAGNEGQLDALDLGFTVFAAGGAPFGPAPTPAGMLPRTGPAALGWVVCLGLLLILTGAASRAASRRKGPDHG